MPKVLPLFALRTNRALCSGPGTTLKGLNTKQERNVEEKLEQMEKAYASPGETRITRVVADTPILSGAGANDIDLANDAAHTSGATWYDTVTVSFAGTNAIAHGLVALISTVITDTAIATRYSFLED